MFVKFHIIYIPTRVFKIQRSTFELAVGVCCCLEICNSAVVNMVGMELILGKPLMVVPTECYPPKSRNIFLL